MPIYEYKCENCDSTFEALQKFNDDPLTECVNCHKGPVKKLMSVSSFVLKGAGFYVNDYKKSSSSDSSSGKSTTSTSSSASTAKSTSTAKKD